MHAVFMLYGKRDCVERMLRDMEAQKHKLPVYSPNGKEKKEVWIQGAIRLLPFGFYEYIFPKEDTHRVLASLGFHLKGDGYNLGKARMAFLRKLLRAKKAPPFDSSQKYLWITDDVGIIPIGIREDKTYTEQESDSKGWTHEAL